MSHELGVACFRAKANCSDSRGRGLCRNLGQSSAQCQFAPCFRRDPPKKCKPKTWLNWFPTNEVRESTKPAAEPRPRATGISRRFFGAHAPNKNSNTIQWFSVGAENQQFFFGMNLGISLNDKGLLIGVLPSFPGNRQVVHLPALSSCAVGALRRCSRCLQPRDWAYGVWVLGNTPVAEGNHSIGEW